MEKICSALFSKYIIDGVQKDLTPSQMLESVKSPFAEEPLAEGALIGRIVDESSDPGLSSAVTDPSLIQDYLSKVLVAQRVFSTIFPQEYTRAQIEKALIDCIWRLGNFRIGDLCLDAKWVWNDTQIGNMAALYSSVEATVEYLDALGLCLRYYGEQNGPCAVDFGVDLRPGIDADSLVERPFGSAKPRLGAASLPSTLQNDPKSWIVYIPFDTSQYRLGGSALAHSIGIKPAVAPEVNDPDYFLDCYEVVRELIEDGIVLSGTTVCEGGLLSALKRMTTPATGAIIDVTDLRHATAEDDPIRLLFSEVPGVIVQIRDIDFDYIDAELLLQDVAFYPIGHPCEGGSVQLHSSSKSGIQHILEALIRKDRGEGED